MNADRIVAILTQLRRLLVKHRVEGFVVDIEKVLKESQLSYQTLRDKVAEEFFRYVGMGSPADLYISKGNGHQVDREKEANYELQALFNALYHEVQPPKDPDGPIKHFWTYPTTHAEWEVQLTSGNLEAIFDVLIMDNLPSCRLALGTELVSVLYTPLKPRCPCCCHKMSGRSGAVAQSFGFR